MIGKIFITRTGYDPQLGKHVKDPYLGPCPTLAACRPDFRKQFRKQLQKGDHIFVISGKIREVNQFVTEKQVLQLRDWLAVLKRASRN